MPRRRLKFSDQIRQAVIQSGMTRYAIWKATGIDQANLCRFVNGEAGMTFGSLDKLADLLGLEVVVKPRKSK